MRFASFRIADQDTYGVALSDTRILDLKAAGARAEPPRAFGDDDMVEEGRVHYGKNCGGCHGANVVAGGVLPDLRYSPLLATEASWRAVVIEGALADKGMVSFAENLTAAEAEALRSYVVSRAHETQ